MQKIGKYEVVGPLSSGPHPPLQVKSPEGVMLAMKVLPTLNASPDLRERFTREAQIGLKLDHPNVVKVLDFGDSDGYLFQVMPFLEGMDLGRTLAENLRLSWEDRLSLMQQVCEGLAYAHSLNLIHRDIKPSNLFLEANGRIRILDFGMVKTADSNLTQAGMAVGTLNYMAPEQIQGQLVSPATDIFAAATVFYQLASGVHPFSGKSKSLPEILTAILSQDPPPLSLVVPDAPQGLEAALKKALQKQPSQRWQSALEFKAALAECKIGAAATVPTELAKTRVIDRATAERLAQSMKAEQQQTVQPPPPAPKAPLPKVEKRFCPQCTFPNALNARVCAGCGAPLVNTSANEPVATKSAVPMYAILGLLAFIAILLLILVLKLAERA